VWLYQTYHSSTAIAIYLSLCALVSLICVALLKDQTGRLDAH
jgi:hypothetical protein